MKKLVLGVLAHVDAGKTTLSEALLYTCGSIRKLGRVDHRNTALDTHKIERERGITVFSKQAQLHTGGMELCLLDTPGHADLTAETERTLDVIDYALRGIRHTLKEAVMICMPVVFGVLNAVDIFFAVA